MNKYDIKKKLLDYGEDVGSEMIEQEFIERKNMSIARTLFILTLGFLIGNIFMYILK